LLHVRNLVSQSLTFIFLLVDMRLRLVLEAPVHGFLRLHVAVETWKLALKLVNLVFLIWDYDEEGDWIFIAAFGTNLTTQTSTNLSCAGQTLIITAGDSSLLGVLRLLVMLLDTKSVVVGRVVIGASARVVVLGSVGALQELKNSISFKLLLNHIL